jgi:hypothetical protein
VKGIIFNIIEDVVRTQYGEDRWDSILEDAGVRGAYTSLGTYPDSELAAIAGAAGAQMGITPEQVIRDVGVAGLAGFAARYPEFFTPVNLRAFLLALNEIIHPEVRKLYPGAQVPMFTFVSLGPTTLDLAYSSRRAMCALAEGLIIRAGQWYGEPIELTQPECVHRGDAKCVLHVTGLAVQPSRGPERDAA